MSIAEVVVEGSATIRSAVLIDWSELDSLQRLTSARHLERGSIYVHAVRTAIHSFVKTPCCSNVHVLILLILHVLC